MLRKSMRGVMKEVKKRGREEVGGRRWKIVSLIVSLLLCVCAAVAVVQGSLECVERVIPSAPAPNSVFEVTLKIKGELPLVVGIVEEIPEGFSFEGTDYEYYEVSGQKIAFAAINVTEIRYKVRAPSSGEGTFMGNWIDMLGDKEGDIAATTVIVGGGGAGAIGAEITPTPTPAPTVAAVTKASRVIPFLEAGKEVGMAFKDLDVSMITVKSNKNVSNMKVIIERVERPADIPEPLGIPYTYFGIKLEGEGIESAEIGGRIEFKVDKSWISDNNIDETTVTLSRYDEKEEKWNALPTYKVGEDDTAVYFEAETPLFAIFAITGERKAEVATTPTPTPVTTLTPTIPTQSPTAQTTPTRSPTTPSPKPSGCKASFVFISLIVLLLLRKRRGERNK